MLIDTFHVQLNLKKKSDGTAFRISIM